MRVNSHVVQLVSFLVNVMFDLDLHLNNKIGTKRLVANIKSRIGLRREGNREQANRRQYNSSRLQNRRWNSRQYN